MRNELSCALKRRDQKSVNRRVLC